MEIQLKTPLYDKLITYSSDNPISFHVPGHKNGVIFQEKGRPIFEGLLKLDVTELTGLDDLHSPEGVIQESQKLLTKLYEVDTSYFLVNGTTVGNLAMIMAAVNEGDVVLVQRNCHKSVLNGLQLSGARPVFINPEYDVDWNVASGLSVNSVQSALKQYPDARALIVTYPNYYGMVYNLSEIIELAHQKNIPVLVDEAHGAHFIAGGPFPSSAVTLGADIVVQSAHKTLPALTMGSFLHFNSKLVSKSRLEKYLHILQSSSPSYLIMASLDLARSYVGTLNDLDIEYLTEQVTEFRRCLGNLPGIKVLSYENDEGDLLKVTIQSTRGMSGFELQDIFEKAGIYAELADPVNVLLIFPLIKVGISYPLVEIISRLRQALLSLEEQEEKQKEFLPLTKEGTSTLELSFGEMEKREMKKVDFDQAVGKICAEMIIPYPPGIPLLFPGEMISEEDVKQIVWHLNKGTRFQGGELLREGYLRVF
ncbi:aminotransferase class I/II-fold pyridoxal phosphate-dependent enzyme [Bacillus marasmi]|uniref:aminotransferase class I/II-fold pyridoxal phosphate-dependent enzyme n=1 Tax=Bacillus marasmi TaxID=1926279 RepID=UPI0011C8EC93|nr:aminotransferase class I/II-fold pyridoxal phosphate-dependent enzyme [Bacillus marasmi]